MFVVPPTRLFSLFPLLKELFTCNWLACWLADCPDWDDLFEYLRSKSSFSIWSHPPMQPTNSRGIVGGTLPLLNLNFNLKRKEEYKSASSAVHTVSLPSLHFLSIHKPWECCSSFSRLEWKTVAQLSPWKSLALMANNIMSEALHFPKRWLVRPTCELDVVYTQHRCSRPWPHPAQNQETRPQFYKLDIPCSWDRTCRGMKAPNEEEAKSRLPVTVLLFFPAVRSYQRKVFFLRVHEKEVQSPHGFNSWCSLLAAAQVFMQCCRKRVNEQHLARYRKLFSKTRKITNPPFFLVFRTMSLLHWGHFRTVTGIAG